MNTEKMTEIILPESQLLADTGTLYGNNLPLDCIIISADNKKLKVHKCVLARRSPVFAAMFAHETTIESQNNTVIIPDFDSNVLKEMVRSMYNEKAVDFTNIEDKLLAAADKYELERLKALCENELTEVMTVENVCEILILATLHSAIRLKSNAIEYIRKHKKEVKASDGWKMLDKEHLRLFI